MFNNNRSGGFGQRSSSGAAEGSGSTRPAAAESLRQDRLARALQRASDKSVRTLQRALRAFWCRRQAAAVLISTMSTPERGGVKYTICTVLRCHFVLLRACCRSSDAFTAVASNLKSLLGTVAEGSLLLMEASRRDDEFRSRVLSRLMHSCVFALDLSTVPAPKTAPPALLLAAVQLLVAVLDPNATCWRATDANDVRLLVVCAVQTATDRFASATMRRERPLLLLRQQFVALRLKVGATHPLVAILRRVIFGLLRAALFLRGPSSRCAEAYLASSGFFVREFVSVVMTTPNLAPDVTDIFVLPMLADGAREWLKQAPPPPLAESKWVLANTISSGFAFFTAPHDDVDSTILFVFRSQWIEAMKTLLIMSRAAAAVQQIIADIADDAALGAQLAPFFSSEGVDLAFDALLRGGPTPGGNGGEQGVSAQTKAAGGGAAETARARKKKGFFASLREKKEARLQLTTSVTSHHAEAQTAEGQALLMSAINASFVFPSWVPFGALYVSCLAKGRVFAVLNTIVHRGAELLPALWRFCCANMAMTDVYAATSPAACPLNHEMLVTVHVGWSLFCAVYAHVLTVTDDNEFSQLQVPFALSTVCDIVRVCNRLLYAVIMKYGTHSGATGSANDPFARDDFGMRANLRRLLRLLLDRSLRVPLLPEATGDAAPKKKKGAEDPNAALWLVPLPKAALDPSNPVCTAAVAKLLGEMPHAIPFEARVAFLRQFIAADRQRYSVDKVKYGMKIRRSHCVQDGFDQFMRIPAADAPALLRARLHIEFTDAFGAKEAGIDAGGVFKEFIEVLVKQAFSPDFGLFSLTSEGGLLHPNPHARRLFASDAEVAQLFQFLGRIVGKAVYEGVVVNLPFAHFFLNNVLGRGNCLDDLRVIDPAQHEALLKLKEMPDAADAFVFFAVEDNVLGEVVVSDIIEGGRDVQVTNENVVRYLHLVAHHRLVKSTKAATDAFVQGLLDLLDRSWLQCFNALELQQLISGSRGLGFDVDDLRQHTKLVGGYKEDSRTLELLWEVLREMSPEDQGRFLQFCTGSSRPPLMGFGAMNPPFSIRRTEEGSVLNLVVDIDRLPTASTCFNLLKLPPYKNKSNLQNKLLQAIRSGAGFDLS